MLAKDCKIGDIITIENQLDSGKQWIVIGRDGTLVLVDPYGPNPATGSWHSDGHYTVSPDRTVVSPDRMVTLEQEELPPPRYPEYAYRIFKDRYDNDSRTWAYAAAQAQSHVNKMVFDDYELITLRAIDSNVVEVLMVKF